MTFLGHHSFLSLYLYPKRALYIALKVVVCSRLLFVLSMIYRTFYGKTFPNSLYFLSTSYLQMSKNPSALLTRLADWQSGQTIESFISLDPKVGIDNSSYAFSLVAGGPDWTRTSDRTLIKRELYQLSY